MRRFAVLVPLLVACAHSQRSKDAHGWLELQSEHFVLRTDLVEEQARKNLIDMEQVRTALLGAGWHGNREEKGRTIVVQLADRGEMEEFALKGLEGFATRNAFGERLLVIHAGEDVFEQGLFKHELTHIISDGYLVSNPRWVAEGIACYLE